jgi:hypothetical protein
MRMLLVKPKGDRYRWRGTTPVSTMMCVCGQRADLRHNPHDLIDRSTEASMLAGRQQMTPAEDVQRKIAVAIK